jgi:hypothetical protein
MNLKYKNNPSIEIGGLFASDPAALRPDLTPSVSMLQDRSSGGG